MRNGRLACGGLVVALGLGLVSCQKEAAPATGVGPTNEGAALAVDVAASATSGTAPLTVNFTSTPRGGRAPYHFSWTFGDGSGSSEQSPVKTYASGGAFQASVTVTSGAERVTSAVVGIAVDAGVRFGCFIGPNDGVAPHDVAVRGSATGGTGDFTYRWVFGDGATASGPSAAHTYDGAGTYAVSGTVQSGGSSASCRDTVRVYERLIHSCRGFSPVGPAPLTVAFVAMANYCEADGCQFAWDFGDGTTATGRGLMRPEHTFNAPGVYDVVVRARTGTAQDACSVRVEAQVP